MLGSELAARFLHQQDLAIDGVLHRIPPDLAVVDAVATQATCDGKDCSLRMRLVGVRSFHNGN
jgi:hypothetical protein